jgi:hypothetical protein
MFISGIVTRGDMATSKTGTFYLNETVTLPAASASGARVTSTIDIGGLVDVGDQQGLAIEEIDWITQVGTDFSGAISQVAASDFALNTQLSDLNPGAAFVRADDNNLISSAHMDVDQGNNSSTESQDFWPDTYGKLDQSRIVVNDQLYVVGGIDANAAPSIAAVYLTCRIKARVVKLSTKDWMAIAITGVSND